MPQGLYWLAWTRVIRVKGHCVFRELTAGSDAFLSLAVFRIRACFLLNRGALGLTVSRASLGALTECGLVTLYRKHVRSRALQVHARREIRSVLYGRPALSIWSARQRQDRHRAHGDKPTDLRRKELDGHEPAQLGVFGLVDHTHSAATEFFDDAVMRKGLAEQPRMLLWFSRC
jgi:hypothetical protein